MTIEQIHQHISVWPQRSIAVASGVVHQIIDAANEVREALPVTALNALKQYEFLKSNPANEQVVLNRDVLLAITSALVSTAPINEPEGE